MKLAISNIAWRSEEDEEIMSLLNELNVRYIEAAPTKEWNDPTAISGREIGGYRAKWEARGIEIVAVQSMLYNRPDLKFFAEQANRDELLKYLTSFIEVSSRLGAQVMVFGSPKNRHRGKMPVEEADELFEQSFRVLGKAAQGKNIFFCVEPNASQYGCDYIINAEEGINSVNRIKNDGIALHLDTACMTLAGDSIDTSIRNARHLLKHFHVSAPFLGQVGKDDGINHGLAAKALHEINYDGYVSIEMRPQEGSNVKGIKAAIEFVQQVYLGQVL